SAQLQKVVLIYKGRRRGLHRTERVEIEKGIIWNDAARRHRVADIALEMQGVLHQARADFVVTQPEHIAMLDTLRLAFFQRAAVLHPNAVDADVGEEKCAVLIADSCMFARNDAFAIRNDSVAVPGPADGSPSLGERRVADQAGLVLRDS